MIEMKMFRLDQLKNNQIHTITRKDTEIRNFFVFQALKSYTTYTINYDTSNEIIDTLIKKAQKTKIFTIFFHYNPQLKTKSMHIEFVRARYSCIVSISLTMANSISLEEKINALFHHIFVPTNVLQIWGNINYELNDYIKSTHRSLIFFNVQKKFKEWYNDSFPHTADCRQVLINMTIDGPVCTCAHRPYKSFYDQWTLSHAIDYTFNSSVHLPFNELNQCFAITKLAKIIRQQWTYEDLEQCMDMQYEHLELTN